MIRFAGIEEKHSEFDTSSILLQPIPYDGTSTWGKGADLGFSAFLEAAENMELYDIETDSEVYKKGVHILPELSGFDSPKRMFESVYKKTEELIKTGKFLTFFGGEHSISIGIMEAFIEKYPDVSILHFDAHADLRPEYNGSEYNHACALHSISKKANLVQIGIRSMDISEKEHLNYDKCFFAKDISDNTEWMEKALTLLGDRVYITFDLDAFDPSIMPGTGTPEPGGLQWYQTMNFLKMVFNTKNVLGFDIVELAPIEGQPSSEFLTAKMYYKMLSYKFSKKG